MQKNSQQALCRAALLALSLNGTCSYANPIVAGEKGRFDIVDFASADGPVDQTGRRDASQALARAISAANNLTANGSPGCVHIPAGIFRIRSKPPAFARAGCISGEGSSQSILRIEPSFEGDLFTWSEAWAETTAGPRVVGLAIVGDPSATAQQNAFVFYDRNDRVFMEDVVVTDLHGRALYSGATRRTPQAYMRESNLRALRFSGDGSSGVPVVEFASKGIGATDATNEIHVSQVDIYGAKGPSFVIRNEGDGAIRDITIDQMRIEGKENGKTGADLLTIGDPVMRGNVNNITFTSLKLLDPYEGFAALRITAPAGRPAPYQITVSGEIGGGLPNGEGLRIDAGRTSSFRLSGIHTRGTNVVVGRGVSEITLDGGGQERHWTYRIDPTSVPGISVPVRRTGDPSQP